jgi:hypothetical protein
VSEYRETYTIDSETYDDLIETIDSARYNVDAALRLVRAGTREWVHLTAASASLTVLLERHSTDASEADDEHLAL